MDAFKVYLPSNACTDVFPNNTASNYQTRFDKVIDLKGNWEVGVQSIMYSSYLDDDQENGEIKLTASKNEGTAINDIYSHSYHLQPDGTWPGFEGIEPEIYEINGDNLTGVLFTLNGMAERIIKRSTVNYIPLFNFYINGQDQVVYHCSDQAFTLVLTNNLAKVLGFDFETVLPSNRPYTAKYMYTRLTNVRLTKTDYLIRYFNDNVQEHYIRVFLDSGVVSRFKSVEENEKAVVEMWQRKIESITKMGAYFKERRLILYNFGEYALRLSPDMSKTFFHPYAIFGSKIERWGLEGPVFKSVTEAQVWYVDIYSKNMEMTSLMETFNITINVSPWKYDSKRKVLLYLNRAVTQEIRSQLKNSWKESEHEFKFNLDLSDFCSLKIGNMIDVTHVSSNLITLLGIPSPPWKTTTQIIKAMKTMSPIHNRSRQLYLLSDMIQTTKFGNDEVHILKDFLHDNVNHKRVIMKSFYPINYVQLRQLQLDHIHLRLVDEHFHDVKIKDSKTLVTLYFQRIE